MTRNRTDLGVVPHTLIAMLIGCTLASGCDSAFDPYKVNSDGPFSMSGYLDLRADTQWVRVMPIRQSMLTAPEKIDAVVTLQNMDTGVTLMLNDSIFRFRDERLGAVAYAHNFWTTERLEATSRYRVQAVRSDGASTTATVVMPPALEFSLLNLEGSDDTVAFRLRADRVLFVDMIHGMKNLEGEQASVVSRRQPPSRPATGPFPLAVEIDETPPFQVGLMPIDRMELRIAAARADWPFGPHLSDLDISLPGRVPSNVEHGHGYVGGVVTWTVPYHPCTVLVSRPDRERSCTLVYDAQSVSVAGRVVRQPCGKPLQVADIWLTEGFAGGGVIRLRWKTGWDGTYRFEGLEPGSDLVLDLGPGAPSLHLPRLSAGQRYEVSDVPVFAAC